MASKPFVAAIDLERRLREESYLPCPQFICGIPLKQITPRILAVLFRIETPFFGDGAVEETHILQFLWACHAENPMREEPKRWFGKTARQRFDASLGAFDFAKAEDEIWQFLEHTFLDAPDGGPTSRPYVCSIASMEYSMACKPFYWSREYTLDQPLRIIYQLRKCRARDNGALLKNRISDPVMDDALNEANSPEEMSRRAAEFRARFGN